MFKTILIRIQKQWKKHLCLVKVSVKRIFSEGRGGRAQNFAGLSATNKVFLLTPSLVFSYFKYHIYIVVHQYFSPLFQLQQLKLDGYLFAKTNISLTDSYVLAIHQCPLGKIYFECKSTPNIQNRTKRLYFFSLWPIFI